MKSQINWGIIGCGNVCEVKSGPAFNRIEGSALVAVMRRDEAKAKDYAIRHGVPRYYTDAEKLIADEAVNAVYIATPPHVHELYTEMVLKAGKAVYIEKPVSIDAVSTERMIALERRYNGKVAVAHYRRGLPLFIRLKEMLHADAIGKVRLILLNTLQPQISADTLHTADYWRVTPSLSGGGLFFDLSPHQLDILYWLFGKPGYSMVHSVNQGKKYDAPDLTLVQLRFENDVYFNGTWHFNTVHTAAEESCTIIGEKGSIRFSFFGEGAIEWKTAEGVTTYSFHNPQHIQEPHIRNVVDFFSGVAENPCSLEEALVTMSVIEKANGQQ